MGPPPLRIVSFLESAKTRPSRYASRIRLLHSSASWRCGNALVGGQINAHIRPAQQITGEKLLDHEALVAKADDEFLDAMGRVMFHDVP